MNGIDWLQFFALLMALVLVGAAVRRRWVGRANFWAMAAVWVVLIAVASVLFGGFRR